MKNSVLATLAYADAVGTPLTALQVQQRLIAPSRIGGESSPTLGETKGSLDELSGSGHVHEENGWYTLHEPPEGMFAERMARANINVEKWKSMLLKARRLQWVPFVRGIAASGSLAVGTTSQTSDWDMFVVAKGGRLYTARIFLLLTCRFMGVLRTKSERVAPDKFCFNHYVTDDGLTIRHRSLYVAHALANLVPFIDRGEVFEQFVKANAWTGDYLAHPGGGSSYMNRSVKPSIFLSAIRSLCETTLAWTIGDAFEAVMKWWQQRRVSRDPATHERGGRVIADDRELEFHPRSAERAVLTRYNEMLNALGMNGREVDSGLL